MKIKTFSMVATFATMALTVAACGGGGDSSGGGAPAGGGSSSSSSSPSLPAGADWTTVQGNANHNGYIAGTFTPSAFSPLWTWTRPDKGATSNGINPVITGGGRLYVTTDDYEGSGELYGVDAASGAVSWKYDIGSAHNVGLPTYANGVVYLVATAGTPSMATLYAINAVTGAQIWKSAAVAGPATNLAAPIADGPFVYVDIGQAGAGGTTVHAFGASDGSLKWTGPLTNSQYVTGAQTPAIDSHYLYNYTGRAIEKIDKNTGALVQTKADSLNNSTPGPYFASPALLDNGNAILYIGTRDTTHYSSPQQDATFETRSLENWFLATGTPTAAGWEDATLHFSVTPATANGVMYIPYNNYNFTGGITITAGGLQAKDANTDAVLWSWSKVQLANLMVNNTIVTDNLVFLSSTTTTYAIDLTTHDTVWTYPKGGYLSLGNNVLYIATGGTTSDGGIVAIKLK